MLGNSPAIILRNWLTYVLRYCIHQQENLVYHNKKGLLNKTEIKLVYNSQVHRKALKQLLYYTHNSRVDLFKKYYKVNEAFVNEAWEIVNVFLM